MVLSWIRLFNNTAISIFQTKLSEEDDAELNYSTQFSVVDKQGLEDAYSCVIEQTNP